MLDYIRGTLSKASLQKVTIEIQGLGYLLFIPFNNYTSLPKLGETVTFFVTTVIREDSQKSYGFLTEKQRNLFESLIDVSGIGPKTALALLGHMEIDSLEQAIAQGKTEIICKIPGVGKKTSERLIIEMRDKIKYVASYENAACPSADGVHADAISALVNLGYNFAQAQKAIKSVSVNMKDPSLPALITAALRNI